MKRAFGVLLVLALVKQGNFTEFRRLLSISPRHLRGLEKFQARRPAPIAAIAPTPAADLAVRHNHCGGGDSGSRPHNRQGTSVR